MNTKYSINKKIAVILKILKMDKMNTKYKKITKYKILLRACKQVVSRLEGDT